MDSKHAIATYTHLTLSVFPALYVYALCMHRYCCAALLFCSSLWRFCGSFSCYLRCALLLLEELKLAQGDVARGGV